MAEKQPQKRNSTTFEKGNKIKGGRPKGVLNKVTQRQKATIEMVMDSLAENIIEDLQNVNSSRRLQVYIDLMNYIKPKLSANKIEQETKVKGDVKINISFGDLINSSTEEVNEDNNNE